MLTVATRDELAADLAQAERSREPIAPLTAAYPDIDVVDAYEIQLLNIRRRLDAGATVYGHKVGLSSKAMQEMMGVNEPDYGHLLSDMVYTEDSPIPTQALLDPHARRGECSLRGVPGRTGPCFRPAGPVGPGKRRAQELTERPIIRQNPAYSGYPLVVIP